MMNVHDVKIQDSIHCSRLVTYSKIANELVLYSNEQLAIILNSAQPMGKSIGGTSALLNIKNTPLFIKKIALTDLERQPQNWMSTRNLFDLPLYYQYGVGSAGFGAWRELASHHLATHWVLSGECCHFPLLYHYRILPKTAHESTAEESIQLERDVTYWENSQAIRTRLLASQQANYEIVLFLEYFSDNLHTWLGQQLNKSQDISEAACQMVEKNLQETIDFLQAHRFLHMDAHFENILTDGKQIYFTDFGLALFANFELSSAELEFFQHHKRYDEYSTRINFLHSIITGLWGREHWIEKLQQYVKNKATNLPLGIKKIIQNYAPIAIIMGKFYRQLQSESKRTPFPAEKLNKLIQ